MARGHAISAETRATIGNEVIAGVPLKELARRYSLSLDHVKKLALRARSSDEKKVHTGTGSLIPAAGVRNDAFVCGGNCEQLRLANDKIRRLQSHILSLVSACIDA